MTRLITSLWIRNNPCMAVFPMECINPGNLADLLAAYQDEMPLDIFA